VIYYNVRGIKEISYIDMLSDVEELSENGAPGGSDSSRVSPPEKSTCKSKCFFQLYSPVASYIASQ